MLDRLPLAARAGRTTLVVGETGAGKDVVARRLHDLSPRRDRPFVVVHCGALPESLVEAELFGHRRGAFTGANEARAGLVRAAGDGTLFLDELNSLPLGAQARLLRFLDSGEYRAVGSDRPERSSAWVIAATNADLSALVSQGGFRADLLFRLSAVVVNVPALRERGDDAILLAQRFLREANPEIQLGPEAMLAIRAWSWPGNVRELKQRVGSAAIFAPGPTVSAEDLGLRAASPRHSSGSNNETLHDVLWRLIERDGLTLPQAVERCESILIDEGLRRNRNNRTRTAARLGIHLRTLYKKLPSAEAACLNGHDEVGAPTPACSTPGRSPRALGALTT